MSCERALLFSLAEFSTRFTLSSSSPSLLLAPMTLTSRPKRPANAVYADVVTDWIVGRLRKKVVYRDDPNLKISNICHVISSNCKTNKMLFFMKKKHFVLFYEFMHFELKTWGGGVKKVVIFIES